MWWLLMAVRVKPLVSARAEYRIELRQQVAQVFLLRRASVKNVKKRSDAWSPVSAIAPQSEDRPAR